MSERTANSNTTDYPISEEAWTVWRNVLADHSPDFLRRAAANVEWFVRYTMRTQAGVMKRLRDLPYD